VQKTLLVPLDGSEVSEASLPWAVKLAQDRGLTLTLCRVADYPHFGGATWPEEAMDFETYDQVLVTEQEEAEQYLNEVRKGLAETGLTVKTIVRHGNPYVTLLDLADELAAAAIVIASHGRGGFKRFVLGSVAMQLVSHTTVPVFLVRATTPENRHTAGLNRLLVPLDGSVLAERALDVARDVTSEGSTLVLVRVVPWPQSFVVEGDTERVRDAEATAYGVKIATGYLDRVAARLRESGIPVETQAIVCETKGAVSRHLAVAAAAWNVDAIVMSTHGRGGVTGWLLGSVADEVVRNVDRPVLLVSARALAARTTGQMQVGDVMTGDVLTLRDDESLVVALRKLVRRRASGAPVLDADGRLVGVISQRDIMAWHERTFEALAEQSGPAPDDYLRRLRTEQIRTVMTTSPTSVPESTSLRAAMALLRERGIHRLPVTRDGHVVGIITGSDLMLAMLAPIDSVHEAHRREELQPSAELLASVGSD
jgi:nucleotide-binding universal stress UspA family protein/predicted transcriptional regulator